MSATPFGIKHKCSNCYATWYIQKKVAEIIGKYGFKTDQESDLVHELSVHLLCKWSQYEPSKSKPTTFIQRIIDSKICGLIRFGAEPKRNHRRLLPLDQARGAEEYGLLDGVRGQPEVSDFDLIDLQSDAAEIMDQLPEELKQIAELLKTERPTAVARQLGIPESTIRKRIKQLRQHFERTGYGDD